MTISHEELTVDGLTVLRLQNAHAQVDVVPEVGGRIISLIHKCTGHEFLWRNKSLPLRRAMPGSVYDPEFYGGIDEQFPCDLPETADGIDYPDHGELWTQGLDAAWEQETLVLSGHLPLSGFRYERRMVLQKDAPVLRVSYRLTNESGCGRLFLWKLHAALDVSPGDRILCPATAARPLDMAWSRCRDNASFAWPECDGTNMSVVPPADGTTEFLALTELTRGQIGLWRRGSGLRLRIEFDTRTFPCCWLFASYGGLFGHYTVVLEPSTTDKLSLSQAELSDQVARLEAGEAIETTVTYHLDVVSEQTENDLEEIWDQSTT